MDNVVNDYIENGNTNEPSSGQILNPTRNSTASDVYDTSWTKKLIKKKKSLTFFLDDILSYDVKKESATGDKKDNLEPASGLESILEARHHSKHIETRRSISTEEILRQDNPTGKKVTEKETSGLVVEKENFSPENSAGREVIEEETSVGAQNDIHQPEDLSRPAINKILSSEGIIKVEETVIHKQELTFKEYITDTWEKYRRKYEHLGEKNPFARDPPSPEFLLDKYGHSGEKVQSAANEDDNTIGIHEKRNISNDNNEDVSLEPDVEPEDEDLQSESGIESDENINNDDSLSPNADLIQETENLGEAIADDTKRSSSMDENVNELCDENDENSQQISKDATTELAVPDIRSLSTNEENYSSKRVASFASDVKVNDTEHQQPEKGTKPNRKKHHKQYNVKSNIQDSIRPLVNPYMVPPYGNASMAPFSNHPFYAFQPPGTPFNYWMAKPPVNHFNMFPYGYPWQGFPFPPTYFPPIYQHNMAPVPYYASPVANHASSISPTPTASQVPTMASPIPSPLSPSSSVTTWGQGQMYEDPGSGHRTINAPGQSAMPLGSHPMASELDEFKVNHNQTKKPTRPYQPQQFRSEFTPPHPGHPVQQNQYFHNRQRVLKASNQPQQSIRQDQRWIPENEINNFENPNLYRRELSEMQEPLNVRQMSLPGPYHVRTSYSPGNEFKTPTNDQWGRDLSIQGSSLSRPHVYHSQPHSHQKTNDPNHQYGTQPSGYRQRFNPEIPSNHASEQAPVPSTPFGPMFPDSPR